MAKADVEIRVGVDDKATGKLKGIGSQMQKMSGTFKKAGIGMMAAGAALGGGLIALAKTAADFEGAMREVNTMVGLSEEGFQDLSKQVQDVASDVGKSSTELSGALYQIVSAGVAAADAIMVLEVASKAAVAGVTDVETAADGLTTVLNAFKIPARDAGKVADIMFTVVKRGKTNFEQLSAAIFNVAPIAAAAGIEFEEVAAAIATVTKQGVPTTVATTQLRAAIQAIIKPTADMTMALDALGVESGETLIAEQGLSGAVAMLREQAGGSLEELGAMFGSVEGLGAVLALTGENAATFAEDLTATTEDAAGAVESAYEEMNKGVGRQFEILFNDIKVMGEEIGATLLPIFKEIIETVKPIIESFKEWVEQNKHLIPVLLKVAAVLIGAGGILFALSLISKAIIAVNVALAIMHGLMGPAGWIKLAAGLAIAGVAIAGIYTLMGKVGVSGAVIPGVEVAPGVFKPPTRMQHGGIVPGPIGQPVPIIAHGGEPFGGIGGKAFGDTYIFNTTVQGSLIAETNLANTIYETFLKRKSRNATLELG